MAMRTTVVQNTLVDASGTPITGQIISAVLQTNGAVVTYNVAGPDIGKSIQPTQLLNQSAVAGPATTPTGTAGSGGSMAAGTYKYAIAYLQNGYETAASPLSAGVVVGASGSVTFSTGGANPLPLGPAGTTARIIYRTQQNGATAYQLATISDNTTTTYVDTALDAALTTTLLALGLGQWRFTLIAPADLSPSTDYYAISQGVQSTYTTSFAFSATPIALSSIYTSSGTPGTTVAAMTGYVTDAAGKAVQGVAVTARLNVNAINTQSGNSVLASTVTTVTTDVNGFYTLSLAPNTNFTPSGTYYIIQEGAQGAVKTVIVPPGGGLVNSNLANVLPTGSSSSVSDASITTTGVVETAKVTTGTHPVAVVTEQLGVATIGYVLRITVTGGGTGYLTGSPPLVTVAGGGGSGCTATATVNASGQVTAITITAPGINFTSVPGVTIAPPTSGVTATATATIFVASGVGTLDYNGFIPLAQLSGITTTQIAAAAGIALGQLSVTNWGPLLKVQNGVLYALDGYQRQTIGLYNQLL